MQSTHTMKRTFDQNFEEWQVGDYIVWEEEKDGPLLKITRLDHEYDRVFWLENGEEQMTRMTNMWRVSK